MNPIPTIDNGRVVYDPSSILNKTMELSSTLDSFYNLTPPSSASSLSSNDTQNGSNLEKHAIESDELKKHRKQKHLEKNKIAAWKCRQRKKIWVEELTKRAEQLTRENSNLKNMILLLRDESIYLKTQLLMYKQRDPYSKFP